MVRDGFSKELALELAVGRRSGSCMAVRVRPSLPREQQVHSSCGQKVLGGSRNLLNTIQWYDVRAESKPGDKSGLCVLP